MTIDSDRLGISMNSYLDFLEGHGDPSSLGDLTYEDQIEAEIWIASMNAARGIDPYASRPSTADLMALANEGQKRKRYIAPDSCPRETTDNG